MSGSLIVKESEDITSRIATLHYAYYDSTEDLKQELESKKDQIQCVVSKDDVSNLKSFRFGEAQKPSITDYADGVDTMEFLKSI